MKPLSLKERMLIESGFMPPLKKSDGEDVPDIEKSVGVLVVKDGKILCGVRAKGSNIGLICGPGGHVKQGESYEQTAFRETEEEFGISPRALLPLGFGPKEPDTGMTPAVFLCTDYDGEPYSNDREMALPCFCSMGELGTLSGAGMLFQPFKDGLAVMIQCLETGNPNISEKPLDKSEQSATIKSQETSEDGGPGSGNHGHKGVPGQVGGSAPKGSGDVTRFPRKGSKMSITSDVKMKFGGKDVTIKAGTGVEKTAVFAGGGAKKPLRVASYLANQYGGDAKDWRHTRGEATVDISGVECQAEVHWFENRSVGQVGIKVKRLMG